MPLWGYTKPPKLPNSYPVDTPIIKTNEGWVAVHPNGIQETLIVIGKMNQKHDDSVGNLEVETGNDFLLEDDSMGNFFILLEQS